MIKDSTTRVQKYLDHLATAKGYDKECIHTFITGDGEEISLLASDLKELAQFAQDSTAQRVPLSEKQVEDLIYAKHFRKGCAALSYASTQVNLNWYRLGLRDGERTHGITQEKQV